MKIRDLNFCRTTTQIMFAACTLLGRNKGNKTPWLVWSALIVPSLLNIPLAQAQQKSEVVSLSDTIVGNQEQPTVLYIVPWKPAEDTTILYLPLSSKATEEIFGHIERVEHQRQVQFIEQLDGD